MTRRAWAIAWTTLALAAGASAQIPNPVYTDVSPSARDALVRAGEMASGGNVAEAARELQKLLDQHPDQVVSSPDDPDLFRSVREQVHRTLLGTPDLLRQYLSAEETKAREQLAAGTIEAARRVESARFLTDAGFEAALRVAQWQLESACFEAARLTLEPLGSHPMRHKPEGREAAREAARLLARVARYLDGPRPEVVERARQWAQESGLEAPGFEPADRPVALGVRPVDVFRAGARLDTASMPPKPLWGVPIEPPNAAEEAGPVVDPRQGAVPKDPTSLWILPTVVGDTLYLNDGTWITARDRFTLQLRWAVEPGREQGDEESRFAARTQGAMTGAGRAVEDNNTVTVAGGVVVTTSGLARDGSRESDPRTHALDAETGEVLWSVHVPGLDPQLESGSVRGPALVDGDTVVLMVRKSALARRIVSVYLVGLALRTGELRWSRLIASAGALPFNRERRITDVHALDRGVVYVCDQLGAAGAVEAATGRPVWIRRLPVAGIAETSLPWRFGAPVPVGSGVFLLSPDHRELLRIDAATGRIAARRSSGVLGDPDYVLAVGDRLAAVGESRVAFLPQADIAQGRVQLSPSIADPGIRGRVVVAGDSLIVPRADGINVVDPSRPGEDHAVKLDAMGTLLAVDSQLLAIDARDVSSYLAWPVAQRLLRERMEADPANPEPAITYAELAFRAGRSGEIAGAVDQALAAIGRDASRNSEARTRLFDCMRRMVETSQERWQPGAPAAPDEPTLEPPALGEVIDRLGRAAKTVDDRLAHLMALGRLREAEGRASLAVEAYQHVLGDAALSQSVWRGPGVRVRADAEAAARVRRLVVENGAECYAAFDGESGAAAGALGPKPAPEAIESVLRRYPGAGQNAELWARVADQHERAGRTGEALDALREGLAAADLSRRAGRRLDPGVEGELAGRLLSRLSAADQVFAASRLLASIRADRPGLGMTDRGVPIDAQRLAGDLAARLARLQRLPRVGEELGTDVQALDGWSLMPPILRERVPTPTEHVVLLSTKESRVGLWGVSGGGAGPGRDDAGPEHVALLWARPYTGSPPRLLRVDPESVYILWDHQEQGRSVERIDTVTGETRWRTDPLRTLLAGNPEHDRRLEFDGERIDTPLDRGCEARDVLVASDGQVLALAERIGRVAVFDTQTGRVLWRTMSDAWRVHDLDVGNGVVVVAGAVPAGGDPRAARETPGVFIHEARSGRLIRRIDQLGAPVRWVRLVAPAPVPTPGLIIALTGEMMAVDPQTGTTTWVIPGGPAFESVDAWVFGERLLVLDGQRDLWLVSLASGRVGDAPLDTLSRLTDAWPIEAVAVPGHDESPHIAFLTSRGVVVFDVGAPGTPPRGRLVGIDALARDTGAGGFPDGAGATPLVAPAMAQDRVFTVETWATRLPDGRPAYTLHSLDSTSGRLEGSTHQLVLYDAPQRLALLDGRVLLTAGSAGGITLVYAAPAPGR